MKRSVVATAVWFLFAPLPSLLNAQNADVGVPVQPSSAIRLTGVLEETKEQRASAFPLLHVWIAGKQQLFRVTKVEPLIPAYPAEEELRKVSGLGLRFIAENQELVGLQSPQMQNRPITIQGTLRTRDGILRVQSVQQAIDHSDEH